MSRKFKQGCLRLAMVMMLALAIPFQSFAANARIAFSDPSAQVGNELSVTMKFTSTSGDVLGNTDVMLSYDAGMLEFLGGSSNASGGAGAIRVTSGMEGKTEIVTNLQFRALQAGTAQITIASWEGYDESGQMLTMDREGSSTITITAPESFSSDASLQSLQISPGTLTPAFSPDVENYTATVGLETERLAVSATANSSAATITTEGGTELQEGENTVVCRVTAEDGTTVRNYTILVTKAEGGENLTGETQGETQPSSLEVLAELEAHKTPLKIGIGAFPEGARMPAGLKESTITIGDTKVQGWTPDVDGQPEYCVFYGVSSNGVEGYYRYDMTEKTIQRYFMETAGTDVDPTLESVVEQYNSLQEDYSKMMLFAIIGGALAVILLVALIVVIVKSSGGGQGGKSSRQEPEKKAEPKHTRRVAGGKKLTREERYMMGVEEEYEEEDYEEDSVALYEEPETVDTDYDVDYDTDYEEEASDAYQPEPAKIKVPAEAPESVEAVERTIADRLARAAAAVAAEPADTEEEEDEDDDFEVFDLDDMKK